ncbi:MAG: hypothetical protein KAS12_01975 [Candidatus Aenigmarchaeota archaeon]|nr:hypothetical protein [Candidatus Aenigmarchaeota archaeon]
MVEIDRSNLISKGKLTKEYCVASKIPSINNLAAIGDVIAVIGELRKYIFIDPRYLKQNLDKSIYPYVDIDGRAGLFNAYKQAKSTIGSVVTDAISQSVGLVCEEPERYAFDAGSLIMKKIESARIDEGIPVGEISDVVGLKQEYLQNIWTPLILNPEVVVMPKDTGFVDTDKLRRHIHAHNEGVLSAKSS